MVKSGITRRIDELGRIVIPKEMRRNLKIQDSDEIDISLDGTNIILNKHEVNNDDKVINMFIYVLSKYLNKNVLFTSRDKIISYSLVNNNRLEKLDLDDNLKNIIKNRKVINDDSNIKLFNNNYHYIVNPLIINGDLFGSIILYSLEEIKDIDSNLFNFSKLFLEKYLE